MCVSVAPHLKGLVDRGQRLSRDGLGVEEIVLVGSLHQRSIKGQEVRRAGLV